jgi:hypothetical protein
MGHGELTLAEMQMQETRSSKEYRNAFYAMLRNRSLSAEERSGVRQRFV